MFNVSVIIPAFNEASCIAEVLKDVQSLKNNVRSLEIIVVDNNSTDETGVIAEALGATVIRESKRGYGQACWTGVQASQGDVLLFVDGDGSVSVNDFVPMIDAIEHGADLAIGVRSNPQPGSMSSAQIFGNALACFLIRTLWRNPIKDLGPLRAITRTLFDSINMQDRSFGWTVEMQVKACKLKAKITDVPVSWLARTGGQSKISGTVSGVILAGTGILGMVAKLWWQEKSQNIALSNTVKAAAKNT